MQEAGIVIRAAPRVAAVGACPLTPGNNLSASLCNNQPESQKLNQAGRGGGGRAQENRDCSINTVIQLSVTADMNLRWGVWGRGVGWGGGLFYLFI